MNRYSGGAAGPAASRPRRRTRPAGPATAVIDSRARWSRAVDPRRYRRSDAPGRASRRRSDEAYETLVRGQFAAAADGGPPHPRLRGRRARCAAGRLHLGLQGGAPLRGPVAAVHLAASHRGEHRADAAAQPEAPSRGAHRVAAAGLQGRRPPGGRARGMGRRRRRSSNGPKRGRSSVRRSTGFPTTTVPSCCSATSKR